MLIYSYPASFMPEETIASAVCRISSSFTVLPNLFQLFQAHRRCQGQIGKFLAAGAHTRQTEK